MIWANWSLDLITISAIYCNALFLRWAEQTWQTCFLFRWQYTVKITVNIHTGAVTDWHTSSSKHHIYPIIPQKSCNSRILNIDVDKEATLIKCSFNVMSSTCGYSLQGHLSSTDLIHPLQTNLEYKRLRKVTSVPKAFLFVCCDIFIIWWYFNVWFKCPKSLRLVTFVTDCFGTAVRF